MDLAAAQHHSAPMCAGSETHEARRGQTTARAGSGWRLWQRCPYRTRRQSRSVTWQLPGCWGRPLRPQGEDSVDGRTLRYLLIVNLALKMKEEEEARRRKREEAEYEAPMQVLDRRVFETEELTLAESYAWRAWAGHLSSQEKKKKRKKKAAEIFLSMLFIPRRSPWEIWTLSSSSPSSLAVLSCFWVLLRQWMHVHASAP